MIDMTFGRCNRSIAAEPPAKYQISGSTASEVIPILKLLKHGYLDSLVQSRHSQAWGATCIIAGQQTTGPWQGC